MQAILLIWSEIVLRPMLNSLVVLYTLLFSNFGLSIIVFTVLVRLLTLPLMMRQLRQTKAMTELQPKLKEMQKKFAKDKQKLSQETMRLYKEAGVNPIGCLGPMLIQLPILIGLYQAISQIIPGTPESLVGLASKLYGWLPLVNEAVPVNTRALWMDLAKPAGENMFNMWLPLLVGVSTWVQQKMMSNPSADPQQQQTNTMMLWMMPMMLGFLTLSFPIGLGIYLLVSNIIGIIIQYYVTGWGSLFSGKKTQELEPVPAETNAPALKEGVNEGLDRSDGEDGRRSDRTSPKRTGRKSRRGRDRRR